MLCILLIAAYLRLGQPGIVEYKRDEANLSQLALDFAQGRAFPLLGIGSSVGFPNAPVNVYILAIPYVLSSNPLHATQFIGLLNVVAVGLTYLLLRRYAGVWPALIVTLLFAVSPWSLIFSRKIWAQNMLPIFVVLTIGTGMLGFLDKKRWAQFAHVPLLALTGQIHYGAFVIIPVSLFVVWQGRRHITRHFWYGAGLAVLLTLPYIIGLMQAGLANPQALREVIASEPDTDSNSLRFTLESLTGAGILVSGVDMHSLAGPEEFENYLAGVPAAYPLFRVLWWAVVAASVWLTYRLFRQRDSRTPVDIVFLLWLWFPVAAFAFTWTPFYIHYLIPIFPAVFGVLALALTDMQHLQRTVLIIAGGAAMVIAAFQVIMWLGLLDFLDDTYTPDGFGTPLHYLLDVREAILADEAEQVIAQVGGQALIYDSEPSVWNTLLPHVRFVDDRTWVLPQGDVLYLTRDCEGGRVFRLRAGEGCYALVETLAMPTDLQPLPEGAAAFDNGVRLLAYDWDGQCLYLAWDISRGTNEDYHFAINFYDAANTRTAQADALAWPGRYWQPGDSVLRAFCLSESQADVAHVEVGMYTFDGAVFNNVNILDAAGNPAGQVVRWSLEP
ncbi:MAG: hypothetical protein OHK0046_07380 [Anaerolineae bacterium]